MNNTFLPQENVPLSAYSTMRLGGPARYLVEIVNRQQIVEALTWAEERQLPVIMIGGGSNIIWRDEGFPGLVLVSKLLRFETNQGDHNNLFVTMGSGEPWDAVVKKCVDTGFSGLEFLSLIPGTVGGAPVQNIGAYGHELADVLVSVEAYDKQLKKLVVIPTADCGFGYRTSRFKTLDHGRFFITSITCHLTKANPQPPFYHFLEDYFQKHNITEPGPAIIREAVVAIRAEKLPDPAVVANTGSFFANPIVDVLTFHEIQKNNPKLSDWPSKWFWEQPDGSYKLAAGALLELLNFKGHEDSETGMSTWPSQALVLVNVRAHSTADLLKFKQKIVDAVQNQFGVTLQQEPELLP